MPADPTKALPVTQADRELVAAIIRHLTSDTKMQSEGATKAERVFNGDFDADPVVQCAVRHRLGAAHG